MNKIFKVIYSKTRHCYVVVSELAKSHVKSSHGNGGQQKAALTMSVLLALGAFTFAFGPVNAEAADEKHYTEGQQYIGVYHTSDEKSVKNAENYQSGLDSKNQGALGVGAISIGVHAEAGAGTITIGNRLAPLAQDSVFIGSKYDVEGKVYKTASSRVVSIGADSNASGTGSVALGYGAEADVSDVSGEGKNPDKEHQSIAIGYKAKAKQNNIAIGANSVATAAASSMATAEFRDKKDSDYNAPSSYVSVGSSTLKRRITNVAAGADENDVATVGQLKKVADNKIAWKLTTAGDSNNASTVSAGDTVDFSAAKDSKENGQVTGKDHSNLTISKEKENGTNKVNMTVGLSDNVVLGQNVSRKGGSLDVYRAVGDASSDTETNENNQSYDQLGSHVRIDGSTVSVHYDNGTDSDARGAVLGIANDSYQDTNDATKTVSSPLGYVYLQDGRNYYYLHGAMHGDTKYQGRLAYDSSESGYNYIANLDDGLKFTGDTKNITVETKLDPNAANNTLSITGGVTDSGKLTSGNIGVVATANTTDENGNVTSAGGLSIQLAKNLTGITSISSQTTSATTGAKIELGTNGTTISGGDVNVSKNKITGLANGSNDTDAATVGQMNTAIGNAKTKYYSVNDKNSISLTPKTLPTVTGLAENSDNLGAKGMGSLASGFSTEADGILSTVGGSYSGVINQNGNSDLDLRGATALSYGTFNINQNTDTQKGYSGVANSIVGQANATTDSNAAIIYGAGNTITNSYRDIDISKFKLSKVKQDLAKNDAAAVVKDLQEAVSTSGGQVMVMGGGNNVESAYMSQVVGVGNTVKGNQVENTKGEWGTDTSDTAIKDYNSEKSSQYNYVDGFNNEVINGKHDYVIGANNKLSGDSYDDDKVLPIKRSNKSNIVIGDNHTLTREKNTVIIGSSDTENTQTKANDAVIIGHNANATSNTGADNAVAIGRKATATGGNAVTIGLNTSAGENSITIGSQSSAISKNNIAIGRYAKVDGDNVTKAVALGWMAEAHVADGVAIGSDSIATVAGNSVKGYDPTGQTSTDTTATWKATNAAVSIGKADGTVTRQINGVAAGTNDTDAVNVAQIKKLASVDASNIGKNFKNGDVTTNENAWGKALGTGTVTKDDDGSKQLVTGGTVYNEVRPSKDGEYVKIAQTTGANLIALDDQVKQNAQNISNNTYTQGDGILMDKTKKTISVNKGDGLKFTEDHKLAVNTGKHLSVNTDGQIEVGDNGTVAENDGNLVTGDTVYKALNGGMTKIIIGTPGKNGKDGTPGTIGLVGPAGTNGKDGVVDITIQTGEDGKDGTKGANGVDGKDGINRIVYEDKNGKHQVATMEDGLKFAGDDGQEDATKAIAKKLNNTVDIIGGADSRKLTANNIGVNNVDGKLKIQLAKNLAGITSIANQTTTGKGDAQTTTGAKIDLKDDGSISVNSGKITDVKSGLTATDGTYADTDKNNAANIGDVHSMIEKEAGNTDDKLALKANVAADNIGTHITDTTAQKTNLDNWGEAIGTGKIADPDASDKEMNGSKQLVTGGTVYNEVRPSKDGEYVKMSQTTGDNLLKLDDQVKQNAQNIFDNTYTQGDGILMDKTKKTISVNQGDGLKFDEGKLAVDAGNGLKIDNGAVAIKTSDSNLKVDSNGIGLSDKITIGSDKTKQVTIDGTKGEISGLTNTTWDSKANDYSKSTKAATESQVDAAVKDAVKQAGDNDVDTHVKADSYGVDANHQVSMDIVDKNGKATGKKVTITDVATHTEVGDVTKLDKGVQNASGTTSVVDAINNLNTSMNTKIGDQNYSKSNTSGTNKYVSDGDSITSAIGKLDGAVQQAASAAGKHSTVSEGSNIKVNGNVQNDGHTDYKVSLKDDISLNSVTAKSATTDTLTVNNSATIGGVTIANKTISGLDDTKIEKGSTNAVNANTIYNELRPATDGNYIKISNTTAQNITNLDTQVKKNSDLVNSDGSTIKIGSKDSATKVDISDKNGSGRVVTGVVTDTNDASSAANVGYVNNMAAANTQQIYRDMNRAYGSLNNNINRAAAGSNALAALHPLDFDPADKASFAVGYGHYRNANAAAVGAFYQPNANTMVNMGVSLGNGDPGFNAGVSFKIGKGSAYNGVSKAEMAQTIHDQATEISAIKADDAAKDKRIDALEKENQEMKKQIQEILARLNG